MKHKELFFLLQREYGPQGWWPLVKTGYHLNNYSIPSNRNEQYEIAIGAILTQGTSWNNVETALLNIYKRGVLSPEGIMSIDKKELSELIKSAGYFNQKAEYIINFTKWFLENKTPSREELLKIKGIGHETADSILLYAYKTPYFIADNYSIRIFSRMGIIPSLLSYESTQKNVHEECRDQDFKFYNEYHALIVQHAKLYCKVNPECLKCPLIAYCEYGSNGK